MGATVFKWTPQSGEYVASEKNNLGTPFWSVFRSNWLAFPIMLGLFWWRAPMWFPFPDALFTLGAYALIALASTGGREVYAGEGWLRDGPTLVRTDRLVKLKLIYTTGGPILRMKDRDGNELSTSSRDLVQEPRIWALLSAGVRKSVDAGLRVNKLTAIAFVLPPSARKKPFWRRASERPLRMH
jgi:hypothetical protein